MKNSVSAQTLPENVADLLDSNVQKIVLQHIRKNIEKSLPHSQQLYAASLGQQQHQKSLLKGTEKSNKKGPTHNMDILRSINC